MVLLELKFKYSRWRRISYSPYWNTLPILGFLSPSFSFWTLHLQWDKNMHMGTYYRCVVNQDYDLSVGKELFLVLCLDKWRGPGATHECYFYINKCPFVLALPHESFRNGSEFILKPCHLTILDTKQIFTANAEYLSLVCGVAVT